MKQKIHVKAPCTIANMGCGFDILGMAIDQTADEVELLANGSNQIVIKDILGADLSKDIDQNIAGKVIQSAQNLLGIKEGVDIVLTKRIVPGSGLGSSAASAVGAVFAYNALVEADLPYHTLLDLALDGEELATGERHADNIAPCLYGGITLVQHSSDIQVTNLPLPTNLKVVATYPQIQIKTADARAVLPKQVALKEAISQWSQVAGLVAGICMNDREAIARSMQDVLIVPHRAKLIADYAILEQKLLDQQVLGCSISGSGPTVFALCDAAADTELIQQLMNTHFNSRGIATQSWVTDIASEGVQIIS